VFLTKSVDDNPNIKWCPAPNCDKIVFCPSVTGISSVVCACGYNFCFSCGEEGHKPCSCKEVKSWIKKCQDDSETANFIVSNTKDCPKCSRSIEKNGGCNHMTCSLCRHEFCWICLGDWAKHGSDYYNCNRYKEKDVDKERENAKTQARAALEKYMHYFTRFATHEQSQKLESKLLQLADQKMKELTQKSQTSWLEVDYIRKGVEQLIECRAALKWTYAYAYNLPAGPQKELFEYLQDELEHNTENLSELLERDSSNKSKILNTTKVAQTRLQHLLKGVDDGLKKN
jgi:ariadne-1